MVKDELDRVRAVRITTVLGILDNGRRISICCPFHSERTPSFYIYPDGSYHCYGQCNKGGQNAIDFLMQAGASFTEAVEELRKYL